MTADPPRWEAYLRSQFPAYLLPASAAERLSVAEATRFLAALTGDPTALARLRGASFLVPRLAELEAFVRGVDELVGVLPSVTEIAERRWIGGFQGRCDVRATAALHAQGRRTEFATRTPQRRFDLPENLVLRAVCARLFALLVELRTAKVLPDTGWGIRGRVCEGKLSRILTVMAQHDVPVGSPDAHDLEVARRARQPGFRDAARWHDELRAGLDDDDPARIARLVADGALLPLDAAKRFEIAVAMKLLAKLNEAVPRARPGGWTHERGLIIAHRRDLATLRRGELAIRVFYNQSVLDEGPVDLGVQHYFDSDRRMRPDVTITVERAGERLSALVVECKHSEDRSYLATGFHEAMLYRHEYGAVLRGAVKSVLVSSGAVPGLPRPGDEVIAVTWDTWPPDAVIDALLAFVPAALTSTTG